MKVGTRVKVVDDDYQFTTHWELFKQMGFKNAYEYRNLRDFENLEETDFVIFSKHQQEEKQLYGIIDEKGNQFLIEESGLEKIKKPKKVKEEQKEKPFPKLMKAIGSELVVFFTSEKIGLVLVGDEYITIYSYSDDWAMDFFEDTKENITVTFK